MIVMDTVFFPKPALLRALSHPYLTMLRAWVMVQPVAARLPIRARPAVGAGPAIAANTNPRLTLNADRGRLSRGRRHLAGLDSAGTRHEGLDWKAPV